MSNDDGGAASEKTLLEEMAMAALPAIASNLFWHDRRDEEQTSWIGIEDMNYCDDMSQAELISSQSYLLAAAMIAEKRRREASNAE